MGPVVVLLPSAVGRSRRADAGLRVGGVVPSWIVALETRVDAARSRAEGLREEISELTEALSQVEIELSRLQITRETMEDVLAAPVSAAAAAVGVVEGVPVAGLARAASLLVAAEQRGDVTVTSPAYRQVVAVFAEEGGARRCKDVLAVLGTKEPSASQVETMRSKLNRLAERGVLERTGPGLFALAGSDSR